MSPRTSQLPQTRRNDGSQCNKADLVCRGEQGQMVKGDGVQAMKVLHRRDGR